MFLPIKRLFLPKLHRLIQQQLWNTLAYIWESERHLCTYIKVDSASKLSLRRVIQKVSLFQPHAIPTNMDGHDFSFDM